MEKEKTIHGIAMGGKRESLTPPLEMLRERGVNISGNVISHIRMGITSGTRIDYRLLCADLLDANSAQLKNEAYLSIALAGIKAQTFREGRASQVLNSLGHTDDIAEAMGLKPQETRRVIRAMRADMVYDNATERKVTPEFIAVATGYLYGYIKPVGIIRKDSVIFRIDDEWDGETFAGFYRLLYQGGPRTIGTWTPYECEIFSFHYKEMARRQNPLSDFDRLMLKSRISSTPPEKLVGRIKETTGIEIDRAVMEEHRDFLVYGKLVTNSQSTNQS